MSSLTPGNCKGCNDYNCNRCQEAIDREHELIEMERQANLITERIHSAKEELIKLYDNETHWLSKKSVDTLHELLQAMYKTESIIKEYR